MAWIMWNKAKNRDCTPEELSKEEARFLADLNLKKHRTPRAKKAAKKK